MEEMEEIDVAVMRIRTREEQIECGGKVVLSWICKGREKGSQPWGQD
jgi:hypothetical protein